MGARYGSRRGSSLASTGMSEDFRSPRRLGIAVATTVIAGGTIALDAADLHGWTEHGVVGATVVATLALARIAISGERRMAEMAVELEDVRAEAEAPVSDRLRREQEWLALQMISPGINPQE